LRQYAATTGAATREKYAQDCLEIMLVVNQRLKIPLREFQFSFVRSSGPGGQNVNKVNTKAMLRWPIKKSTHISAAVRERFLIKYHRRVTADGDLIITSQRYRDQGRNVADCLAKLRDLLESVATPPKSRRPTKPTKASQRRRKHDKEARSRQKKLRRSPKMDD
jgi:ribosome-associated protein